ncbi:DUF5946 family protein [Bacillus sp. B-jedd]|uniref:DUF5946 family protein n=1 Tax=Bacillus sp. B-jedd TaxID=1476857 RepID=UPI00051572AE|nr:DUF5946 family protein [Bacillus sp. B-jedd]CEG28457.1 hypothetical protein BN1002_03375 [Bacillus sp. B-jedd]
MNRLLNIQKCCPECGAPEANGLDCRGQLNEIISWEAENPDLLSRHFWTVACYNIQHPSLFTDAAWRRFCEVYCEAYDRGWPISKIRQQVSNLAEGAVNVMKEVPADPVYREWAMTISEVYLVGERKGAADRVAAWAKVVRKQI